jgi:hypothetical protein
MKKKLLITGVTTISHCDQQITAENDEAKVIVHLKDQNDFLEPHKAIGKELKLFKPENASAENKKLAEENANLKEQVKKLSTDLAALKVPLVSDETESDNA